MPAISVVMPTLNQREFIAEAVHSVMAQEVDDLELVVMDGGSSDGTLLELQALEQAFSGRLRWFSGPDAGPADAVHRGLLEARAPLIGWLNSDDLYCPGAIRRAMAHLSEHPEQVMVYGQGEHVDVDGRHLADYPTLPPSTPLEVFADGCFICQPTAFFRRAVYLDLGGLDTSLKTAFDFDLWLRLFKRHPDGIGFIDALQARTRLHEGAITMRMRQLVALEALEVLHRQLGAAPGHWLLTHFEELCAQHPFHAEPTTLSAAMTSLVERAAAWLGPGHANDILQRIEADRRAQVSTADTAISIHADGWAGETSELRLQQGSKPLARVCLVCSNDRPGGGLLRLHIHAPDGNVETIDVDCQGGFEFVVPVSDRRPGAMSIWRIVAEGAFVPAEIEPASSDTRRLAFRVRQMLTEPA